MIPVIRPWLGEEEAAAAAAAVASGWVAQGPRVAEFEAAFAAAVGTGHGVAVSSCTAGLHLAMVVAGVGPGDEVIVPSLSFIATANAVRYVGARPVFADVEPATQNLTTETVEPCITGRTRAVILVDQAGVPADLDSMTALCAPRGIAVIEDAACAAGSQYRGRSAGAGAWLAAFSFHPRKLITTGEGGMLVTPDGELAARLRRLREHGMTVSAAERHHRRQPVVEQYAEVGFNYRMTDVQAAIGLVQLAKLGQMVARRRDLAHRYQTLLSAVPGLLTAQDPPYGETNYQSFWILLPAEALVSRDELLQTARRCWHIRTARHHGRSPGACVRGIRPYPLPVTELLTTRSLILPLFHQMTESQQDLVVSVIHGAVTGSTSAMSAL